MDDKSEKIGVEENQSNPADVLASEPSFEEHAVDVTRELGYVGNLDDTLPALLKISEEKGGVPVSMEFNGHTIRSDMSEDDMYLEVTGSTKEEYEKKIEERRKRWEEKEAAELAEAEAKMPERIAAGDALIYTEKQDEWRRCVDARTHDLYHGLELASALKAMTLLENGASFEEVEQALDDDNHSGISYRMTLNIIFSFSKKGPDFYQAVREKERGAPLTEEELRRVEEQKLKNAQMESHDAKLNEQ